MPFCPLLAAGLSVPALLLVGFPMPLVSWQALVSITKINSRPNHLEVVFMDRSILPT
jgi:hypothetical protein